ncbi:hypothetical protein Tco_0257815 [Tanacetum coccineum]
MSNTNTNLQTQTSNALHNVIMEAGGKDRPPMLAPGNYVQWKSRIKRYIDTKPNNELIHYWYLENYKNVSQDIRDQLNAEVEAVQIIPTGIDNDIYSTVDACPNVCEIWKTIKRLKQGESINVQDLKTNLYWDFEKSTSRDGESLESYCLSSYFNYNQNGKVNKIRAKRLAHTANPLALVAQQQPVYHPQNYPNHYTQNSSTKSQQASTRNRGKAIVNSPPPTYDQEPTMVAKDDEMSKEKEIDKLIALISLPFKKIYKPTNNNLKTSSNTNNAENSGPIIDVEPLQKIQNNDDNYNVFAIESEHPEQPESRTVDQDDNDDLAKERDLLASLITKLKCEIDDSKNRNKLLESSNKILVNKLTSQLDDFKNKNECLESSNTHFKEANDELKKTNQMMFKDLKKFQDELEKRHDVNYMSKVELDCAKAKTKLMSYKMESQKSINNYSYQINDLNQKKSDMKKELLAHQETISTMSQQKEEQTKFYKTREEKELEKVIALENKIKSLDDIVYKTGQSVQTMNMLNRNCKTSFVKPEFLKKAQRANPRLYDIGCYIDNLALMLAPDSDKTIRLAQESRSKLSDLIRPFDYEKLNNLYDLFVPQHEKSPEERYFSEREYYYANHMNAILGVYTTLDEFTDLQCDYVEQIVKCERLEQEISKSNTRSKSFEALQQHAFNLELALQQCQEHIKI